MGGGEGGGGGGSAALESPAHFAEEAPEGADPIITGSIPLTAEDLSFAMGVAVATVDQGKDPDAYLAYFASNLLEPAS